MKILARDSTARLGVLEAAADAERFRWILTALARGGARVSDREARSFLHWARRVPGFTYADGTEMVSSRESRDG